MRIKPTKCNKIYSWKDTLSFLRIFYEYRIFRCVKVNSFLEKNLINVSQEVHLVNKKAYARKHVLFKKNEEIHLLN